MKKRYRSQSSVSRPGCTLFHAILLFTLTFFLSFSPNSVVAQNEKIPTEESAIAAGEKLFKGNCTVCHAINEKVIGPALRGVTERRNLPWLRAFIRNSQKVIQSGDEYAVNLYNEYNKTEMTAFGFFSPAEINSILAYVKAESVKEIAPVATAESVSAAPGETMGGLSASASPWIHAVMVILLVIIVLILIILFSIVTLLKKHVSPSGEVTEEKNPSTLGKIVKGNAFLGLLVFAGTAVLLKAGIDGLFTIGVQQGYQPEQPIAFSHKIHAGDYKIDCNYCHTGVRISKSANIPSLNICMNCHSAIKTKSPKIQKIYAAIEDKKPIEWVRIHNLPDLAYFNHAQHVKVGNIACQTCHGQVEEMEVVKQHAPLTMGWCIDCHRKTDVNTKGNEYYTKLVALHQQHSDKSMKVENMGGLECSKCHY